MNRLPKAKREAAEALLKSGESVRTVKNTTGIHTVTAIAIRRRLGVQLPEPSSERKRDRSEYLKKYFQGMNHLQRTERNNLVRASAALWLAKNVKPMAAEKLFSALLPEWPHLKLQSLEYMLNRNADHWFVSVRGKWTYEPSPYYHPMLLFKEGRPISHYHQLVNAARAAWFDARGLKDEVWEACVENLTTKQKEFVQRKQLEAIMAAQPMLRIMATASAIASHPTNQP